ncbi:Para-hydroxybenzoate--polyprenyltransferase, mitochondrial precursor (PHB:polyprenyltransferase) [Ceratobasidium sp. 428]|nr:Para-hydroxybenzoate--polyprenyltransferase, mitochondrial precursor (PHB:polyprenyltransferase) [Ceratobasidium sp. 428]
MVYDTIYAHQDKKDDPLTGIRSTALLFGDNTRPILSAFAVSTVSLIGMAGLECGMGTGYFGGPTNKPKASDSGRFNWREYCIEPNLTTELTAGRTLSNAVGLAFGCGQDRL